MSQETPAFEVKADVRWDATAKCWYPETTLHVAGVVQQVEVWSQVSYTNMRRAKKMARTIAEKQAEHIKRAILEEMFKMGEGLANS